MKNISKIFLTILLLNFFILTFCKKEIIKNSNQTIKQDAIDKQKQENPDSKLDFSFIKCPEDSKNIDYCIEVYEPVCGWFTNKPSDCNSIYCRESYANSCFACKDKRVIGYTKGNCKN